MYADLSQFSKRPPFVSVHWIVTMVDNQLRAIASHEHSKNLQPTHVRRMFVSFNVDMKKIFGIRHDPIARCFHISASLFPCLLCSLMYVDLRRSITNWTLVVLSHHRMILCVASGIMRRSAMEIVSTKMDSVWPLVNNELASLVMSQWVYKRLLERGAHCFITAGRSIATFTDAQKASFL